MDMLHGGKKAMRYTIIAMFLFLFFTLGKTEVKAASYTEKIDGIQWTVSVGTDGDVSVKPKSKAQIIGDITIPKKVCGYKVTSIGEHAFDGCNMTSVTIPESIKTLKEYCFAGCNRLTNVIIPDSVTVIGTAAFFNSQGLTSVVISNSVTSIEDFAFFQCMKLKSVILPNKLTTIHDASFRYCTSLESVVIPESVTDIEIEAFYNCNKLTNVVIPDKVTNIGARAFYNCYRMENITIPASAKTIGELAFYYCESFTNIVIPDSVISIGKSAFYTCHNMRTIVIPSSVTSIGESAFYNCNHLETVYYRGTNSQWDTLQQSIGTSNNPLIECPSIYCSYVSITDQPVSAVYQVQSTAVNSLTVGVTTELPAVKIAYQWYSNEDGNHTTGTAIKGATSNSYLPSTKALGSTYYYCQVKSTYKGVTTSISSASAKVTNTKNVPVSKPEERPVPYIEDGTAYILLNNERIVIQKYVKGIGSDEDSFMKLYQQSDVMKGEPQSKEVTLTESGYYTFYVKDDMENDFYLVKCFNPITEQGEKDSIDLSMLVYELDAAQTTCDTVPVGKSGLGIGASYTSEEAKSAFQNAINTIRSKMGLITLQSEADKMLEELKESEVVFSQTIQQVEWEYITVDGSSISIHGMEGCTVTRVEYNSDDSGKLAQGIWKNWAGFTSISHKIKYSKFTWKDVDDGIYTFIISQQDAAGQVTSSYETVVVSQKRTRDEVVRNYLDGQLSTAKAVITSKSSEADVEAGESCVSVSVYRTLLSNIENTETVLAGTHPSEKDMVSASLTLSESVRNFQNNVHIKEDCAAAVISVKAGMINVFRANLYKFSMAKGSYQNWQQYKDADYTSYYVSNGAVSVQADSNGTYTLRLYYKDESCEYIQVEVTDALEGNDLNGTIQVLYHGNQDVISTSLAYDTGGDNFDFSIYKGLTTELQAFGNGIHIIKIKYVNGQEDCIRVNVLGCSAPVIVAGDNALTIYDYGFSLQTAVCAKGHFTTWAEMQDGIINLDFNTAMNTTEFEKGEYTFYFQDIDGKSYWEYVTLK